MEEGGGGGREGGMLNFHKTLGSQSSRAFPPGKSKVPYKECVEGGGGEHSSHKICDYRYLSVKFFHISESLVTEDDSYKAQCDGMYYIYIYTRISLYCSVQCDVRVDSQPKINSVTGE